MVEVVSDVDHMIGLPSDHVEALEGEFGAAEQCGMPPLAVGYQSLYGVARGDDVCVVPEFVQRAHQIEDRSASTVERWLPVTLIDNEDLVHSE